MSANTNNQTQMTDNDTSEAPAAEEASGADDNTNANLSIEDLAGSFVEKVEAEAEDDSTTEATEDVTESEVVDAIEEEDEETVLSESSEEEDSDDEEEDDEPEENQPRGLQKALKQINRLTARAKSAEETVEALKDQIQNLKSSDSPTPTQPAKPALEDVNSLEDLAKLEAEARAAKKWSLQNLGKGFVEIEGREEGFTDDDIRDILTESEEYLTERIPQRAEYLRQKEGWDKDTKKVFPFITKGSGSDYEDYVQVRENPLYKGFLDAQPNGDFLAATLLAGIKSVQAKQKAKPVKKAKTPPTDVSDSVAPPVETKEARQRKKKEAVLGKGNVSVDQFAAYLT